ncbi:MAG: CHAT domain-containing protein [Blastocatellia bacterium]
MNNVGMQLAEFALHLASVTEAEQSRLLETKRVFSAVAVAEALRQLCYDSWMSDPARTERIASAIRLLDDKQDNNQEVTAVRFWIDGIVFLTKGEMSGADRLLKLSSEMYEKLGKPLDSAETCVSRMYALAVLGRYAEAIKCGNKARKTFLRYDKPKSAGKIEHNLGNIYQRLDRYSEAERILNLAVKRFSVAEDSEKLIQIKTSLANAYAHQTKFRDAEALYEQSLEGARKYGHFVTQAQIESNLGYLSLLSGNYARSLHLFELSRSRFVSMGMDSQAAIAEQEVADVYLELNLFPEAERLYRRIVPVFEQLGMKAEMARALAFQSRALVGLGENHLAHKLLKKASRLYKGEKNFIGLAISGLIEARLYFLEQNYSKAKNKAKQSSKSFRNAHAWGRAIEALVIEAASLIRLGDKSEAREMLTVALERTLTIDLPQSQLLCLTALGSLEIIEKNLVAAETHFLRAVGLIEKIRSPLPGEEFRTGFIADKLSPYYELIGIYLTNDTTEMVAKAFELSERARSRSLMETLELQNFNIHVEDPESKKVSERKVEIRGELNWLYREISNQMKSSTEHRKKLSEKICLREQEISEITMQLAARSHGNMLFDAGQVTLSELQSNIGTETAMIEYMVLDGGFAAYVVTNEKITAIKNLATETEIGELLKQLNFQIEMFKHSSDPLSSQNSNLRTRQILFELFIRLIKPLQSMTEERNLVIVPFQKLNYVPFPALFDGFEYLIESREIVCVPSASFFCRNHGKKDATGKSALFLGLADEKAPHIERELKTLGSMFPKSNLYINDDATLENLSSKCKSAAILHLACHGKFRSDNPFFSSLSLYDGLLTVRDVYDLDLGNCDLAVLSACETGISEIARGEELLGLIRGFLCAGAANILLTLWQVDDEVSTDLMIEFYKHLAEGLTFSAALTKVQRKMVADGLHPFYWAPFFLVGRL